MTTAPVLPDAWPLATGIGDLGRPDRGQPVAPAGAEVPVVRVTPRAVLATVGPAVAITHAAGRILVTGSPEATPRDRPP